jgi:DNA-binding NarL/FixJ family response regulator
VIAHHVSAILRKLDVRARTQASTRAARLGLVAQTSVGTASNLG